MRILSVFIPLFLTGCILVGDFGVCWEKGRVDSALEGAWYAENGRDSFRFDRSGRSMLWVLDKGESPQVRSLTFGGVSFLMAKAPDSSSDPNILQRYRIKNGRLVFYILPRDKREALLRQHPSVFEDRRNGPFVPKLNEEAVRILTEIAAQEAWWKEKARYSLTPPQKP